MQSILFELSRRKIHFLNVACVDARFEDVSDS